MRFLFISIFIFLSLACSVAQVSVTATVDSTHMLIGDQMNLRLSVRHQSGTVVQLPDVSAPKDTMIEFLKQGTWDTLEKGGSFLLQRNLIFTVWDSGYHVLPALPVIYRQKEGRDTIYTEEIPMQVMMPPVDSTLADIKPIIEEPSTLRDYLPYILGVLGVVVIVLAIVFLIRRKPEKKEAPAEPVIVLLPHEIALQRLEALKKEKLWQQGKIKAYYSELTFIVRDYLENRYGIQALESTTGEILRQMQKATLPASLSEKLEVLLRNADLVKFAKAQPPTDFHQQAMNYAEEFILTTKPATVPAGETQATDVQ